MGFSLPLLIQLSRVHTGARCPGFIGERLSDYPLSQQVDINGIRSVFELSNGSCLYGLESLEGVVQVGSPWEEATH